NNQIRQQAKAFGGTLQLLWGGHNWHIHKRLGPRHSVGGPHPLGPAHPAGPENNGRRYPQHALIHLS
ncbi:Hypothetical protein FKW44_005791, partial [Caligus rogercresseyi]